MSGIDRRKALKIIGCTTISAVWPVVGMADVAGNAEHLVTLETAVRKRRYFGYRSFMPEYETMKKFRAIGVDTFTFMVSNNENLYGLPYTKYQPTWIWERKYDFSLFDRNIQDITDTVPDARLICFIDLNPPTWWVRRGGRYGKRFDPYYDLGRIASSSEWREDTAHYLQALISHAEGTYPGLCTAFVIGGGTTTEWFDSSCGAESIYRLQGFRKFTAKNGKPEPTNIPSYSERYHGSHDTDNIDQLYARFNPDAEYTGIRNKPSGMFRTPDENGPALDYWRFNNEQIADAVGFFIRKARHVLSPETELGVIFGYMTDIGQFMHASMGHLEYEKIFSMPELDFAVEPMSYAGREMGGSSSTMIPGETLNLMGKRLLVSCDHRTFTMRFPNNTGGENPWKNGIEVTAGIRRETCYNLIHGNSTWWFDMWGGWWDSPEAMEAIKKGKEIWDQEAEMETSGVSEVLFLVDPQNMYYVNDSRLDCGKFDILVRKCLNHIGTPHTFGSFNDLERMDLSRFRLVILCHPFELGTAKTELLERKVMNSDRTILWIYGPGIINNGKWDPGNVRKVCGTAYKTPGVNHVAMKGWNSVYIYDTNTLTPEMLREVAIRAGCHMYCHQLRPVYANNRLLALHTGVAGALTLDFRSVRKTITELYSGKEFHNTKTVTVEPIGPETFLFRY